MEARIEGIVVSLRETVSALEPSELDPTEATRLVELFAEAERLCVAGRTLAAGRVAETRAWAASGARTPAQWLASRTQSHLGNAIAAIDTARRLQQLPATRDMFVSGGLSEVQAAEIVSAAAADPAAEGHLLRIARRENIQMLRERCREVRAAAAADEDASERIRRGRFLRHWSDRDGAVRLDGRFAPDDGAKLVAVITARAARLQAQARRAKQTEHADAYTADALVGLATDEQAPRAIVHVEVDRAAFERGHTERGEICRIPGVGPVPVAVARRLAADGVVKVIEREGVDVRRVTHLGRTIPAHLRTALEARDPTCVVPGCDVRNGLEIDHIVPFAQGGPTRLDNLARLCRFHHAQKTHHGWRLRGSPGEWEWLRAPTRGGAT